MAVLNRVETLEDVAKTLDEQDERRTAILAVIESDLRAAPPVRPVIAAQIIDLSEKTVRNWAAHGLLASSPPGSGKSSRLLLQLSSVHQVRHMLDDARASDDAGTLIDRVYRRLVDATWANRDDLRTSLREMRDGDYEVRVPRAAE